MAGLIMYKFLKVKDAYKEARKFNRHETTAPFPPYVTIELLDKCNFRCRMCSLTYQQSAGNVFPLHELKKLVDEIAKYGSMIRFIGYCEPLLYPHIKEAVAYVKNKGLLLHITTNASLLSREMADYLVSMGLDSIIFSFQGASKEEYMKMRSLGGTIYDRVIENISYFHSIRKHTEMKLTTTVTERDTKEDIESFIQTHSAYVDEVQVSGFTHFIHVSDHFGEQDIWGELGINKPELKKPAAECFLPNFEMLVKPDGSACACCGAYTEGLVYGNVFTKDIMDVWQGGKAEKLRTKICGGELEDLENCRVCPVRYKYANIDNAVYNTRK